EKPRGSIRLPTTSSRSAPEPSGPPRRARRGLRRRASSRPAHLPGAPRPSDGAGLPRLGRVDRLELSQGVPVPGDAAVALGQAPDFRTAVEELEDVVEPEVGADRIELLADAPDELVVLPVVERPAVRHRAVAARLPGDVPDAKSVRVVPEERSRVLAVGGAAR